VIDIVLDANVALDWFIVSEPGLAYSAHLAELSTREAVRFHVPVHFDVEVCGQLVRHHRRKASPFSKEWLELSLNTLETQTIDTHAIGLRFKPMAQLALTYGLTVYDVPYFHLARMLEIPIASRDKGIIAACKNWDVIHWQPD
jgi:predicted nucleic acid-binding protein